MAKKSKMPAIGSPLYMYPSDSTGTPLTQIILTGENYSTWAKVVRRALEAKNKAGFVDGVVHAADARAMWDELKERFSQGNVPRIHQLKAEINLLRQDGQSVTEYFTKLKGLWDKLADYTDTVTCTCAGCTCDVSKRLAAEREIEMLHQFLMGLNTESYEERQRSIQRDQETPKDHVIALAAGGKGSAPRYICDPCGKTGHLKSRCYELIGYPKNWERNKDDSGRRNNNRHGQRPDGPNGGGSNKPTAPRGPSAAHSAQTNGAAAGESTTSLHTLTDMEYRQLINLLGSVKMASSQPSGTQPLEVFLSRDAIFHEHDFPYMSQTPQPTLIPPTDPPNHTSLSDEPTSSDPPTLLPPQVTRTASSAPPDHHPDTPDEGTTHSDDSSEMPPDRLADSPHPPAADSAPIAATPAPSRRPARARCPPARFEDYHCYSVVPTPIAASPLHLLLQVWAIPLSVSSIITVFLYLTWPS
ncbi:Unknown protein [Striga hermonthica]|uniref:CCHC-type domain-containing protein n=1 Tax=Striga hermonthica TaxID=68872 RepID=A0A9N7R9K2_STRHE|nr:Unknown protein [Striga hermonthica]